MMRKPSRKTEVVAEADLILGGGLPVLRRRPRQLDGARTMLEKYGFLAVWAPPQW